MPFLREQAVRADPVSVIVSDGGDDQLVGADRLLEALKLVSNWPSPECSGRLESTTM
jgi:hypothetical protein